MCGVVVGDNVAVKRLMIIIRKCWFFYCLFFLSRYLFVLLLSIILIKLTHQISILILLRS